MEENRFVKIRQILYQEMDEFCKRSGMEIHGSLDKMRKEPCVVYSYYQYRENSDILKALNREIMDNDLCLCTSIKKYKIKL